MIEQQPCHACGGSGISGIVTRDMALDAGEPTMEGRPLTCNYCGGLGCMEVEVPDPEEAGL